MTSSPAIAGEGQDDGPPTRKRSARLWRIVAGTAGALVILAALSLTALRIALAYVPQHADRLGAWIEQQTHMRVEYAALDARLRWYGPEVVLRDVRVLDRDGGQALFTTREGSVGLDLWNFFRTGELVAGRLRFANPQVTFVRLRDGRFRLLGLGERPADRPPFDFDRLPAGRVVIEDATVVYRDLVTGRPPVALTELDGEVRRDRDFVVIEGKARLPQTLGTKLKFSARLKGSLDDRERLDARVETRVDDLQLAGLADVLAGTRLQPRDGQGALHGVVSLKQGKLAGVRLELDLQNVALRLPARHVPPVVAVQVSNPRLEPSASGFIPQATVTRELVDRPVATLPAEARYAVLRGDLRLRREQDTWTFRADELTVQPDATRTRISTGIEGKWQGHPHSRFGLELRLANADLPTLWPLALAFAPASFDRWAGLAPTGRIRELQLQAARERAGLLPTFTVNGDVVGLGVRPHEVSPGLSGITANFRGTDRGGKLQLRAEEPAFDWPRYFRDPLAVIRATADVTWHREGKVWHLSARGARLEHPQGRAKVAFDFSFERSNKSPELSLQADVEDVDVSVVPRVIPAGRLQPKTIAWLDRAFVAGHASNGHLEYRGPVRKFPFRHGEGTFTATVDARDVTLDYFAGFEPLTGASGKARFHNQSIEADLGSGRVGALRVTRGKFVMSDYRYPVFKVDAAAEGDLAGGLSFLQASPLGPELGNQFMSLRGAGPGRYDVNLTLPAVLPERLRELAEPPPPRDWLVRALLDGVTVSYPPLRVPAQRVTGAFELHNLEVRVPSIKGTILDGPFEMSATPGRLSRDVPVAVDFAARGRAGGVGLPAFIGLPGTIRMAGATDWALQGHIEKRRSTGAWPMQFDVASTLAGLTVDAPRPFAKDAAESRPTRVRIDIPTAHTSEVAIDSGNARARLRFAESGGRWRLDRGMARFDAQPATWPAQPGLLVAGNWPRFDLGEWLALAGGDATPGTAAPSQRLKDWLGPVDVHLDHATVFGYEFPDVAARLRSNGDDWQVDVSGPRVLGRVTVPDDYTLGRPIVLDLERLTLVSDDDKSPAPRAGTPRFADKDPRKLPALDVHAEEFTWSSRQFGRVQAAVRRDARGLVLNRLTASGPDFELNANGAWVVEASGPRSNLELEFTSGNLAAAARALGYRDAIEADKARVTANLWWPGGPSEDAKARLNGTLRMSLEDGQLRDVEPGAGRMLGLLSVGQLPRRLALDFRDVTDEGLAFNSVRGDFELKNGSAYTENLLLKGPALDIGVVGRTGLGTEDYDQTMVVSGNPSGPLAVAGALAAGPVVGAGVLVLSQLFKGQLQGLTRAYYHVSGPWSSPVVERISAPTPAEPAAATAGATK